MQQNWFKSWFNSPYYHILYNNRDDQEAEHFIDKLSQHLEIKTHARVLDIACGKGRHSIFLRKKGFDVTGTDLSENSIAHAKQFEDEQLHFYVHDMRKLLYINYFDISLNLFTSFGYFESDKDHVNALTAFRKGLKEDGVFVLDYFNTHKVVAQMEASTEKVAEGITFEINKRVEHGKILKNIKFQDQGFNFNFTERVSAFTLEDFKRLLTMAGFEITEVFGNYDLEAYQKDTSDRLILICKKI